MAMFQDMIRLFACYNDGIINLLGNNNTFNNSSNHNNVYGARIIMTKVTERVHQVHLMNVD